MAAVNITTDLIVSAARITQHVYEGNAGKLIDKHVDLAIREIKRAQIMDALAEDEQLCEMLAGRIHQLGSGVPSS